MDEEEHAMLEAIFVECTCYKLAGSLTPEERDSVVDEVTEDLMKVLRCSSATCFLPCHWASAQGPEYCPDQDTGSVLIWKVNRK